MERTRPAHSGEDFELPEPAPAGGLAYAAPAHHEQILRLQRSAGNQAVTAALSAAGGGILARNGTQTTTAESAYDDAVRARQWEAAARALAAMEAASRTARINGATTDVLVHVSRAAEAAELVDVRNAVAIKLQEPAHAGRAQQIMRDEEFTAAMGVPDWERVVRALNQYDPPDIPPKLEPLSLEQLNEICAAGRRMGATFERVLTPAESVRVRRLGEAWEAAFRGGSWERAVILVQAYNDIDLPLQLDRLDNDQITALSAQADRMLPGYQRVRTAAEPVRIRKLGEAYQAAVDGANWTRAVTLVNAYNDADLLPRCRYIHGKGGTALADATTAAAALWSDDNNRVRRTLAFLAVEPLTGSAVRPTQALGSALTPGTAEPGVAVPGGTVTYSSGASYGPHSNVYGLSYAGTDAQKTGWIQFIARNIEKFDASGNSLGFHAGSWTPSGQGARNFSSPSSPTWFLDTLSNQAPFYEAASSGSGGGRGLSETSPTQTTMYDAPAGRNDIVAPIFAGDANVKSVKSRVMFDTFLVREMQVLRRETIGVEFTYTAAPTAGGPQPTPVTTHTGGAAIDHIPMDRYRAMTARFPTFSYLPHR